MYAHTHVYTYMTWKLKQDCLGKGRVLAGTGVADVVKIDDIVEQKCLWTPLLCIVSISYRKKWVLLSVVHTYYPYVQLKY